MKIRIAAALLALSFTMPAFAEDAIPPAALEQIHLAQRLADLGEARKDPVLMLAAAKLMKTLDDEGAPYGEPVDYKALMEKARAYASESSDLKNVIEDVDAESSKGYYYCPPHRYSCS